jgi:hypothetical protein
VVDSPAPSAPQSNESRYLVLAAITVLGTAAGAGLVALAFGALLSFLPLPVGLLLGLLLGLALPLVLALRASAALKRKNRGLLVRRLVVLFLIGATQLALFGGVLNWSSRGTGDLAWTAHETLEVVGGVPVVSDLLRAHAERAGAIPDAALAAKKQALEAAPDVNDGGVRVADGGPAAALADGGIDAAPLAPATASARNPQPARPKPGVPLSPRTAGKAARTFAAAVTLSDGNTVLFVGTIAAGGAMTMRIVDLLAHEKLGDPTLVECAEDGTAAAILGGAHVVVARAGRGSAEVVKALSPGQKLGADEIQSVRDVVIGPGGAGLAIVSVLAADGSVAERLVALPKGTAPPTVLRKAGDKVPDAAHEATTARSWSFKKGSGAGSVLVVETFLDGGADVGTRLSGETFTVNPQRLVAIKLDAPKGLVELARTGLEPSGIAGLELQIFGDATLLPDGRAVFDANFTEKGSDGWLFVAKPSGGVFALTPEKRDMDSAPWSSSAARVRALEASAEGRLVFRRDDGAAVLLSLDRPGEAVAALLGADVLTSGGKVAGTIASVDVPSLVRGEWVLASVQLRTAGGSTRDAIVLASRADVDNGKAEVLLQVGGALPSTTGASVRSIQSIRYGKGRDELLWP